MSVFDYVMFVGAPVSRVWDALVIPEQASEYTLVPMHSIDLRPGGSIIYGSEEEPVITGKIQQVEPHAVLSHTFRLAHRPDDPETLVLFELEEMGRMTRLCLSHGEFTLDNGTFSDISGGWPIILSSMKTYLETGDHLPWPEDNNRA